MISVIFTLGSRIFSELKRQLNKPPEPLECKTDCDPDTAPSLSATRYNPKTRKCECYNTNTNNIKLQTCQEKINVILGVEISPFWEIDDTCCCKCELDSSYCIDRGWAYIGTDNDISSLDMALDCKCDCENRVASGVYYLSYDDCPIAPTIGYPPEIAGKKIWNEFTCDCECEKLHWFKGCEEPFVKGPNCNCICNPDNIPETCETLMNGSIGIFDSFRSCSCIYPCSPDSTPYYCNPKNPELPPTLENNVLRCAKCEENEYLGNCIPEGPYMAIRMCCPYGTIWKEKTGCVECNEQNAPTCERGFSQLDTKYCRCCPQNYLYDDYLEECVLACETIYSPDEARYLTSEECDGGRLITDDCDCICPPSLTWYNGSCVPPNEICPLPSDHPDHNPLKTLWDPIEEKCICDTNITCDTENSITNSLLDPEDCECKCRGDFILIDNEICHCPSGLGLRRIDDGNFEPSCYPCGDIHGYMPLSDEPLAIWVDYECECIEGYTFEKLTQEQIDEKIDPRCVSCEEYTANAIFIDGKCDCAPGFIRDSDPDFPFDMTGIFICVPEPSPSPYITPTPLP